MLFLGLLATVAPDGRDRALDIFEHYNKLIYKIAYDILKCPQDAEDVLEEVMLSVIKNIEKFLCANRNETAAQLVIYSRNAAINVYNKNKRRRKAEMSLTYYDEDDEAKETDLEDVDASLDEIVISNETVAVVKKYLQMLPESQRDAIKLVYDFGYTNVEAAKILHITPNAVAMRLFSAKKRLLELAGGELSEYL